jgi:hypothetical protein
MTSIRRTALRVLVSLAATVTVGLIGATAASAQTVTPTNDLSWSSPADLSW